MEMKKISSYAAMLFMGTIMLSSCETDNDSNPTLVQPTSFVLNNPTVGEGVVDLAKSNGIDLAWSQPQYTDMNTPVVATYAVQVSSSGTFEKEFDAAAEDNTGADFITLDETSTLCKTFVSATAVAKGLQQINKWTAEDVPATVDLAIRVKASVKDAASSEYFPVLSNVVNVKAIPYYVELSDADPNWWYLIGGDIGDGKWADDVPASLFPLQPKKDYEFDKKTGDGELTWTGYVAGTGFKLKKAPGDWDHQWGMNDGSLIENDGGSGNITYEPGYYTVTLNTGKHTLSVAPYTDKISYNGQAYITGSFNGWTADNPMTPVHAAAGENNHDWYIEISFDAGAEVKFYDGADWESLNIGGSLNKLSDGVYGYGTSGGANIVIEEAGTYIVIFNDITGYYRFIKK